MILIKQSSTQHALRFFLVQSADHITGLTGATPTVKLSKAGGTGAAPSGAVTEIDSTNLPGWYKVAANATDTNTLGAIDIHATATSADPCDVMDAAFIVPFDPTDAVALGLSRIDAAVSSRMATYTQPTGFLAATFPTTVASPTNITAGTITTVTTVTNQLTAAQIATGVWQDTTAGDFTVALSVGKSLMNGVALGTGLTVNDLTTKTGFALTSAYDAAKTASQAGDVMKVSSGTGANQINLSSGNLAGSVASVVGAVGSVTGNVSGSVGSISGITFPTNFSATLISVGGAVTVGTVNAGVIDSVAFAQSAADRTWSSTTRTLTGSQGIKKNTAKAAFAFAMTDSTNHQPATGLTVTAQRSLDGAAFANAANAVVEVSAGWYKIDLAAADLNADTVALKFTATGADQLNVSLVTSP